MRRAEPCRDISCVDCSSAVPVLVGISVVLFAILALAPGDPFGELALNPNIPPEVRFNLRKQFGLDDPLVVRYVRWLTAMLHGDWGYSFVSRLPVQQLILQRLPTTAVCAGLGVCAGAPDRVASGHSLGHETLLVF